MDKLYKQSLFCNWRLLKGSGNWKVISQSSSLCSSVCFFASPSGTFVLLLLQGVDFLTVLCHVLCSAQEGPSPSWLFSPLSVLYRRSLLMPARQVQAQTDTFRVHSLHSHVCRRLLTAKSINNPFVVWHVPLQQRDHTQRQFICQTKIYIIYKYILYINRRKLFVINCEQRPYFIQLVFENQAHTFLSCAFLHVPQKGSTLSTPHSEKLPAKLSQ